MLNSDTVGIQHIRQLCSNLHANDNFNKWLHLTFLKDLKNF